MALYRRKRKQPTHHRPSDYRELWTAVIMLVIVGIALGLVYLYARPALPEKATIEAPAQQTQQRTP